MKPELLSSSVRFNCFCQYVGLCLSNCGGDGKFRQLAVASLRRIVERGTDSTSTQASMVLCDVVLCNSDNQSEAHETAVATQIVDWFQNSVLRCVSRLEPGGAQLSDAEASLVAVARVLRVAHYILDATSRLSKAGRGQHDQRVDIFVLVEQSLPLDDDDILASCPLYIPLSVDPHVDPDTLGDIVKEHMVLTVVCLGFIPQILATLPLCIHCL